MSDDLIISSGAVVTCSRRLEWDSMHRVPGHDGACRAYHGHRYLAEITCSGCIQDSGMIIDFGVVKAVVGDWIKEHLDHTAILHRDDDDAAVRAIMASNARHGKPVYLLANPPTAEWIATELAHVAGELLGQFNITVEEVKLAETPNSYATWRRL